MFSWNNGPAKDQDEAESFNGKIARTQVQRLVADQKYWSVIAR